MTIRTFHVAAAACLCAAPLLFATPPPASLGLDSFYEKHVDAGGYPVVSSAKVSDYALLEAAHLVNMMLAHRPDVKAAMARGGSRLVVMAYNEFTTDIPEHRGLKPADYWNRRARGLGGSETDPVCSCAEENLLNFAGDPYREECIMIHEFAHSIHLRGMSVVDPTFGRRVHQAYDEAMAKGLWKDKYASQNAAEYFAEGAQSWFDDNRENDHDHNHVDTRAELMAYDPALAALCREVFGDGAASYTKATTRLTGHLAGYDPAKAPRFTWPERLAEKKDEVVKKSLDERRRRQAEREAKAAAAPTGDHK